MRRLAALILLFVCGLLSACATPEPLLRARAAAMVDEISRQDAARLMPQEFANLLETHQYGEKILLEQEDDETADSFYQLTLQKGEILRGELKRLKERQLAEERRKLAEAAAKAKEERLMREAAEAEERLRKQEEQWAAEEAEQDRLRKEEARREQRAAQPKTHTVRRGETLPQIAARTEIYNDASLWYLIYRANRDQIRDPKQLWPGQVLTIPRNFSRKEAGEARDFSGRK